MKQWEPSVPIVPLFRNEDSDSAHADIRGRAHRHAGNVEGSAGDLRFMRDLIPASGE